MEIVETERRRIADMVERYGLRVEAGPAKRPHASPINRNQEEPNVAAAVRRHFAAMAGMIRAGLDAEADWPTPQ